MKSAECVRNNDRVLLSAQLVVIIREGGREGKRGERGGERDGREREGGGEREGGEERDGREDLLQ